MWCLVLHDGMKVWSHKGFWNKDWCGDLWFQWDEISGRNRSKTYLEAKLAGKSMAKAGDGSSLVTSFCISFALLRRMEARSLEKEPLRRVRPTHFYLRVHIAQDEGFVSRRWK